MNAVPSKPVMPLATKLLLFFWSPLGILPLVLVMSEVHVPQPFSYGWHKALHVLGAAVMVGDLFTQIVWISGANRTRNAAVIRAAQRTLSVTDLLFLGPGMFLVMANGALLAQAWGGVYPWSWLVGALLLFGVWGTLSVPLTWIQLAQSRVVQTGSDEEVVAAMSKPSRALALMAMLMVLIPAVIVVLMVVKPRLW